VLAYTGRKLRRFVMVNLNLSYIASVKIRRKIWRGAVLEVFLVDCGFLPSAAI